MCSPGDKKKTALREKTGFINPGTCRAVLSVTGNRPINSAVTSFKKFERRDTFESLMKA